MTAIVANAVGFLRYSLERLGLIQVARNHPWNLPLPKVEHLYLTDEEIRHFEEIVIIGDVHGCYDEMIELLMFINTPQMVITDTNRHDVDRIVQSMEKNSRVLKIFTGDLVNKGPKNSLVIDYFLKAVELRTSLKLKPSCLSVRGNHDDVVIREYMKWKNDPASLMEKNKWMTQLSQTQINFLIELPFTISLPHPINATVVHAGIIPGHRPENMSIKDLVTMRNVIGDEDRFIATSNINEGEAWASKYKGPEHVYFGHDAKRKLQKHPYATGLDTGCVYGGHLSGIIVHGERKSQMIQVKAKKVYEQPKGND